MRAKQVNVIGNGSMGTVLALLLASSGIKTRIWGAFSQSVDQLIQDRENRRYLPGYPIPETIELTSEDNLALAGGDLILNAIPTQHIRSVWQRLAGHLPEGVPVVSVSKGVENETLLRPTQIINDVLRDARQAQWPVAALSGPSVAAELAEHMPATVCAASEDSQVAQLVQESFNTQWFRVYTNSDLLGVELAGATKNVIALAAGMIDGLKVGINAKSALLARGLAEIARLGHAMGARQETFFGIAGVGDLATTCFSPTGRNRTAGEMLGKGMPLDEVLEQVPGIVEGVPTTRSVVELAKKHGIEMPITQAVHTILFDGLSPTEAIRQLMTRQPKEERVG
jgi:glycerol-3-phosphate dehydrogenase (NAD(P)+)